MSGIRKLTHAFPGEHYLVVRPVRDDFRRSVIEVPRRGHRKRQQARRRDQRKIGKQLMKDTHKGRPAKKAPARKAPVTQKAQRPMSVTSIQSKMNKVSKPPNFSKDAGIKLHKPRVISPHHPYLYHVLPVRQIAQHIKIK